MTNGLVHVDAYVRDDGTQVKDHWRGLGARAEICFPEPKDPEGPGDLLPDERYRKKGPLERMFPNPTMSAIDDSGSAEGGSGDVLSGGVETTDWGGIGDAIGNVIGVVVVVAVQAAKVAAKMYAEVQKAKGSGNAQQYQGQFNAHFAKIETAQNDLKDAISENIKELTKTKNQSEYSKLLAAHSKLNELYQKNAANIKQVKIASHNKDYEAVLEGLKNYQSNAQEVVAQNRVQNPLSTQLRQPNGYSGAPHSFAPVPDPFLNANTPVNVLPGMLQKGLVGLGMGAYNQLKSDGLYDAKELWKASSHDFSQSNDYINQNGNMVSSLSQLPSPELQQTVRAKLQSQLGVKDSIGVVFRPDSSLSEAIAGSSEFKGHVQAHAAELLKGAVVKEASTHFTSDKNLALALGHADILYTHIDANGDLNAIVLDTYDFNADDPRWEVQQASGAQTAGVIRNYYTLNIIVVPMSQWSRW